MGVQHKKDLCENGKDLQATVKRPLCIWFCTWETSIFLPVILEREGFQASYFQQGFICYYDEQGSLLREIGTVNQEHAAESRSEAALSTWGRVCCWGGGWSEGMGMHNIPCRQGLKIWDFDLLCLKIRVILQNLDLVVISRLIILKCRFLGPILNLSHMPVKNIEEVGVCGCSVQDTRQVVCFPCPACPCAHWPESTSEIFLCLR